MKRNCKKIADEQKRLIREREAHEQRESVKQRFGVSASLPHIKSDLDVHEEDSNDFLDFTRKRVTKTALFAVWSPSASLGIRSCQGHGTMNFA